jgi:toxin YoeB
MFNREDLNYDKLATKQLEKLYERDEQHFEKVIAIINDILEFGYGGHFRPEMLKSNLSGWCSKEVDKKNRVVYKIKDGKILIAQVMGHYDDH